MQEELIAKFFEHYVVIKMMHFQTRSGFIHLKVDGYTSTFLEKLDKFFEVAQGEFGRLKSREIKLDVKLATDETFAAHLDSFVSVLKDYELPDTVASTRDELVAEIMKLQYLLTFK